MSRPNGEDGSTVERLAFSERETLADEGLRRGEPAPGRFFVEGNVLLGRYRVKKKIGEGGIGEVWLAADMKTHDRSVILKTLKPESLKLPLLVRKFSDEAKALSRLRHPNIVDILDVDVLPGGIPLIVMAFVEGAPLGKWIPDGGLDWETAAGLLLQCAQALNRIHASNIAHRDLKPDNILVERTDPDSLRVRIIDFGISKILETGPAEPSGILLTPGYAAPEQWTGASSPASDVYSFGVIAFEVLTGGRPPGQDSPSSSASIREQVRIAAPEVPVEIGELIERALSMDPAGRPAVAEFVRAIQGAAIPAPVEPPKSRGKERGWLPWLVGTIGLLVVCASLIGFLKTTSPPPDLVRMDARGPVPKPVLEYWLLVRRVGPKGKPDGKPFQVTTTTVLGNGSGVRLQFESLETGYVYLVNEGSRIRADGLPQYVVLFPSPLERGGDSAVGKEAVSIPTDSWWILDQQEGRETLWLVWSRNRHPLFESLIRYVNHQQKGEITGTDDARRLSAFFGDRKNGSSGQIDDERNRSVMLTGDDVAVRRIFIEHR